MKNSQKYYYVYRLTCTHPEAQEKYYYGYRSSTSLPSDDTTYWSSSRYVQAAIAHYGFQWFRKKILAIYSSAEEALLHEIALHHRFNVKDHPLFFNRANQLSRKFTTPAVLSREHIEKVRAAALGKTHSLESCLKMSQVKKQPRKPLSTEHKKKIRDGLKNRVLKCSLETRQKMSQKKKRKKTGPRSQQTKERISKSLAQWHRQKNHILVTCPWCGKQGYNPGMKSWHFENCKTL
jgi:hypothetical protein